MRHRAKFHHNRSRFNAFQNGGRPPSWICEIRIFLQSERLRDKFCISIPNFVKIGDIAIFVIFQVAAAAILFFFQKFEILTAYNGKRPICVAVPNLIEIGQTVAEIWRFNGFFSKWRPSAILDLLGAYWDHPRRPLDGLYRCAKFG